MTANSRFLRATFADQAVRLTAVTLIIQLLVSRKLWIPYGREFPLIPFFGSIPLSLGVTFDALLSIAVVLLLIAQLWKPFCRTISACLLIIFIVLVLEDVSRLQPWLYLDSLLYLTILLRKKETDLERILPLVVLFSLSATYLWSGVQKCNLAFATEFFPWLMDFVAPPTFFLNHKWIAAIVPLIEIAVGIGLITKRFRTQACWLAIGTHVFILLTLGPLVHNWNVVIWPWAIQWIIFAVMIKGFHFDLALGSLDLRYKRMFAAYLLLLYILPVMNYADRWDHHLSGSLYSGNNPEAIFYYDPSDRKHLPKSTEQFQYANAEGKEFVLIDHWAIQDLEAPFYPQERYFRAVGKALLKNISLPSKAGIIMTVKKKWSSEQSLLTIPADSL